MKLKPIGSLAELRRLTKSRNIHEKVRVGYQEVARAAVIQLGGVGADVDTVEHALAFLEESASGGEHIVVHEVNACIGE